MDENLYQNLSGELRRGTQILAVLSQLDDDQYGYSLLQKLEEKQVEIEAGTLYPLLRRLEAQGLLSSEWDTSENRPRKYYALSTEGKETFAKLKIEWENLVHKMDELLRGKTQ
ncbi:MAG: helix-turn-helix transcriptional regulator [Bacilli bacterium]|nr:helix-turn-helix transcriptional regulator [Bacilli bacterium]MBN2696088.1 helix-turn-helix transcriptional regulator [Bacilli bacterium]